MEKEVKKVRESEFEFEARSLAGYQGRVNQSSQLNGFREKRGRSRVRERDKVCAKQSR